MSSVDETSTDLGLSGAPAAQSLTPPPVAKRAAKLTLWWPFAGLLILVAFIFMASIQGNAAPHPVIASVVVAVCCLIWAVGLVLGITALRRSKTEGRKGVLGRTLIGMTLNLFFLGATIWGAVLVVAMKTEITQMHADEQAEANFSRALVKLDAMQKSAQRLAEDGKGEAALIGAVSTNLIQKQKAVLENFYASAKPVSHGHLLSMAEVQQPDEIEQRKDLVRKSIVATKALADFSHNVENDYREELVQSGVPLSSVASGLQALHTNLIAINPWVERMGAARLEWAQNELAAFDLLKTNWGRWSYDGDLKKVVFQDKSQAAEFNHLVREINRTSQRMQALQRQMLRLQ